jgi:hypothetical protein
MLRTSGALPFRTLLFVLATKLEKLDERRALESMNFVIKIMKKYDI